MIKETINIAAFNADSLFEQIIVKDIIIKEAELYSINFYECDFKNCDFSKTSFMGCTFSDCTFENCNLTLVKIPNCKIDNTTFSECKLVGIDWCVAKWRATQPKKKHNFTLEFNKCVLNYSIFIEMNLTKAKFINCNYLKLILQRATSPVQFLEKQISLKQT
ncbi:MAG: pentapeptide repeat-containing protein [Bacteroidales bacterium]